MKLRKLNAKSLTIFTGIVLVALVGLFGFTYMSLLPGPLSEHAHTEYNSGGYHSHADFEMGCAHCHTPIHCISSTKCQDCHLDVAEQRAQASGLHGNLPDTTRCNTCHIEHQGRDNDIRIMAYTNVDHYKMSGFSLEHHTEDYAGQAMDCTSCHLQDSGMEDAPDCITCHVQEDHDRTALHVKLVGSNCTHCHDGQDRMKDFVHDNVYPLKGGHAAAACADCHLEQVFVGTPTDCAGCHHEPDMHAGEFGDDCARCHNTVAWAPAYLIQHDFNLVHTEEGTPLQCKECHASTYAQHDCTSCHGAADPMHVTHLDYAGDETQDCADCHRTGTPEEALKLMSDDTARLQDSQAPVLDLQSYLDLLKDSGEAD